MQAAEGGKAWCAWGATSGPAWLEHREQTSQGRVGEDLVCSAGSSGFTPRARVLNRGHFPVSEGIFDCHHQGGKDATSNCWVEARDMLIILNAQDSTSLPRPPKNYPVPSMDNAKVEKPYS